MRAFLSGPILRVELEIVINCYSSAGQRRASGNQLCRNCTTYQNIQLGNRRLTGVFGEMAELKWC